MYMYTIFNIIIEFYNNIKYIYIYFDICDCVEECDEAGDKERQQHLATVNQLQQTAREAESELDNCQTTASQCQTSLSVAQAEL